MYVNRKDAIEILGRLSREPYYQHEGEDYFVGIADATGEICSMQSAEVAPVIRAYWMVPDTNYPETCSNCLFEYARDEDDDYLPKFCPECGAEMEKNVYHLYL